MKALCSQTLIVLIFLSSVTSIAQCQIRLDSGYVFTPQEVKFINYSLESRRILMLDTADYIKRINNYNIEVNSLNGIVSALKTKESANNTYIGILKEDIYGLIKERDLLFDKNEELIKQKKTLTIGLPIVFCVGIIIGIL